MIAIRPTMSVTHEELVALVLRICSRLRDTWVTERASAISLVYDEKQDLYNLEALARSLGLPDEAIARMHLRWVTPEHMKLFLSSLLARLEGKRGEASQMGHD